MSNISAIIAAIPAAKIPALLVEARAFQAATADLVAAAAAEQPPDLGGATTPKNLAEVYADAVAFEVGHDARVRHANTLAQIAADRTGAAEQITASRLEGWFAEQLNNAVKVLADLVTKQGGVDPAIAKAGGWQFDPELAELREALGGVAKWGRVRTNYTYRFESQPANVVMSIPYEKHSRTAVLADHATAMVLESAATRYGHLEAGYWLAALQTPGVTLCWQTTAQQDTQPAPAAITRERAAMADEFMAQATARQSA